MHPYNRIFVEGIEEDIYDVTGASDDDGSLDLIDGLGNKPPEDPLKDLLVGSMFAPLDNGLKNGLGGVYQQQQP